MTKNKCLRFKMIGFVLVILFALSFPCKGELFLPPEGDKFFVAPGSKVVMEWTFDDNITGVFLRQWFDPAGDSVGRVTDDGAVKPGTSKLSGVEIKKPGTLILKNVDLSHNGTYKFSLSTNQAVEPSSVTVFVKVNSNVTHNCSSVIAVDEGGDVRCLGKAQGENPPVTMKVTWYKDGDQIGSTRDEENMLSLINVDKTANGTYICKAKGNYDLTGESKSTTVIVDFKPVVISLSPEEAQLNKSVIITCEASAHPEANYTIYHNGRKVSDEKTYEIDIVKYSHAGLYQCVAKNELGDGSKTINVTVTSKDPPTMPTLTPTPTTKSTDTQGGNTGTTSTATPSVNVPSGEPGVSSTNIGLIVGIIIGVLLLLLLIVFLLWWFKYRKEKSSGEHIGNDVNPSNQGSAPIANENAYESLADGEGKKPENLYDEARLGNDNGGSGSTSDSLPPVYATADKDKDKKKNKKKDKKKDEPAPANTPPVYATVDKTRHNEPSVTYATLDTVAMQPTGSSKRDRRDQPTEYASIAEFGVKGDLV